MPTPVPALNATKTAKKATTPGKAAAGAAKKSAPRPSEAKGSAAPTPTKTGDAYEVRAVTGGFATFALATGAKVSKVWKHQNDAMADADTRNGWKRGTRPAFPTPPPAAAVSTSTAPSAETPGQSDPQEDGVPGPQTAQEPATPAALPQKARKTASTPQAAKTTARKTAAKTAPATKTAKRAPQTAPAAQPGTKTKTSTKTPRTAAGTRTSDPRLLSGDLGLRGATVEVVGGPKIGTVGTLRRFTLSQGRYPIWTIHTAEGPVNAKADFIKVTAKPTKAAA